MSDNWIAGLWGQVRAATARSESLFANLLDTRASISGRLERTLATLGRAADVRAAAAPPSTKPRILEALRSRSYRALTVREQRYAATLFTEVSADEMRDFLSERPNNWKAFATECFKNWGALNKVADRPGYTRLLCLAPPSVTFVHYGGRPQDIVSPDGPAHLARLLPTRQLIEFRDALLEAGFDPTWSFSAITMATWFAARSNDPNAFASGWAAVRLDRVVETMLLPPPAGKTTSWFADEPRPARVRQSLTAQATFVAAMIRAADHGRATEAHWSAFTDHLLRSSFNDPRVPPESKGWGLLRSIDVRSYDAFLEQLISEDITVFFEHAMVDKRRKNFWLRYVGSLRRTVAVLDQRTKQRLTQRFAGADEKYSAAISRARTFTAQASVQTFCLYFDSIVVVEFAESGNAAQVYERDYFSRMFERMIYTDGCRDNTVLKTPKARRNTPGVGPHLPHVAHWEGSVEDILEELGIERPECSSKRRDPNR